MSKTSQHIRILIGMMLIVMIPHISMLPPWVILWCLCLWSYAIIAPGYNWPDPPKMLLRMLTLLGFAGVILTYRSGLKPEAWVSLLATMAGLKPLETTSDKDRTVIVFLTWFLVIATLNDSTSVSILVYMLLSVLITTTVLTHINHPQGRLMLQLRQTAKIMVQALPLMLIMFFLFPRLSESLVERQGDTAGITGFSDTLAPGDIVQLSRSAETAFRVEFDGPVPQQENLYWRGIVFHYFDGKKWRSDPRRVMRSRPLEGERAVRYSVMLEPHGKRWLFALELPATAPDFAGILREHVLVAEKIVNRRTQYDVTSYLQFKAEDLDERDRRYVRMTGRGNPQARALAREWKDATDTTEQLVALALDYFKTNDFAYTQEPPPVRGDAIDDFLFRTRRGYCEHYASAFAFLMHAAGIPARVVGGYLGGDINPYGDYLMVRQYHAHAWTEVWLEGRGWIRVDPTSAVAPEQVGERAAPDQLSSFVNRLGLSEYFTNLRLGWDALNNQWNVWFFSYSYYRQKRVFSRIGIELDSWFDPIKMFVLMICVTGMFVLILVLLSLKKKTIPHDDVLLLYNRFCKKLAGIGLAREPAEGPVDYAGRVSKARQDLSEDVQDITSLYIMLRYDRGGDGDTLKSFKAMIRRFKPVRRPVEGAANQ